jgi:hypothetical protein
MVPSEDDLLHGALVSSLAAPLLALAYVAPYLDGSRDLFCALLAVFVIVGFVSAPATLLLGLPFALSLRRRGSLGWLPVCAFGLVAGTVVLSPSGTGYGAVFGLANAVVFQVICHGKHVAGRSR